MMGEAKENQKWSLAGDIIHHVGIDTIKIYADGQGLVNAIRSATIVFQPAMSAQYPLTSSSLLLLHSPSLSFSLFISLSLSLFDLTYILRVHVCRFKWKLLCSIQCWCEHQCWALHHQLGCHLEERPSIIK